GSRRSPWDQLQGVTRLEGPSTISTSEDTTINALRQRVLALVTLLQRTRAGFTRHCRALAAGELQGELSLHDFLTIWLDAALAALADARAGVSRALPSDSPEITCERGLADEFVSVRLLDWLADAQRVTDATVRAIPSPAPEVEHALLAVNERLSLALDAEVAYRTTRGYPRANPDVPEMLESYVERSGRLKKHFLELLVLERDVRQVNERVQQWLTSAAALFAGALYFVMQLVIARFPGTWSHSLGAGLAFLALLGGVTYAIRDRLKALGRAWLTGKVYRYHAQRLVRASVSGDRLSTRDVVVEAREWCNETSVRRPDPLNPESGAVLRLTLVEHLHRGRVMPQAALSSSGVQRVKQVFRYDLSPLFPNLQDVVKSVPVVDPETHRAYFVDAPRRYQIPVRLVLTLHGPHASRDEQAAILVIDKQGIVRLDPVSASAPDTVTSRMVETSLVTSA
ncbi:MAG: hypothetical protein K0S65_3831, partial [Labilithrix sp.]|nr:hypothetical protein [Labilithrix sp.]